MLSSFEYCVAMTCSSHSLIMDDDEIAGKTTSKDTSTSNKPVFKIDRPKPSRPTAVRLLPVSDSPKNHQNPLESPKNPQNPLAGTSCSSELLRPKTIRLRPASDPKTDGNIARRVSAMGSRNLEFSDIVKPLVKHADRIEASSPRPNTMVHAQPIVASSSRNKVETTNKNSLEDPSHRPTTTDKASSDGYNWRKYGQKHVKGSEYPRSYYKCTHPNCPVKKKVESSLDGKVTEIVYKGEHNHPKPQPLKKPSSGPHTSHCSDADVEIHGVHSVSADDVNDYSSSLYVDSSIKNESHVHDFSAIALKGYNGSPPLCPSDDVDGLGGEDADEEDHDCRVRKKQKTINDLINEPAQSREGKLVVQTSTDVEIMEDGFKWRKYGQKVVKGNPYPRSYYKCTNTDCGVRKHVERASEDPKSFVTTYEGKHNHDPPQAKAAGNQLASSSSSFQDKGRQLQNKDRLNSNSNANTEKP